LSCFSHIPSLHPPLLLSLPPSLSAPILLALSPLPLLSSSLLLSCVQVPQFVLIGIAEIFASITSLEFFYSQAPSQMRSVSQAMNLFTNALGSWLAIPLTLLVNINPNNEWIASNVDDGHLEYYFFLLAGLMAIAQIVYSTLSGGFIYADPEILQELSKQTKKDGGDDTANKGVGHHDRTPLVTRREEDEEEGEDEVVFHA
jgi:hypothetical protein